MRDKSIAKRLLKEHDCCELCGDRRNLEVHHIVPMCIDTNGVNLDIEDNMIVVCGKCHAMLTPKSVLTKLGQAKKCYVKKNNPRYQFYSRLNEMLDVEGKLYTEDVFNVFDEVAEVQGW